MKLNKRYSRSIKANLPFYISASVLTAVTLLMFYLFYISGTGINRYGDEFFDKYKLESASFSTYAEIPDGKIAELEAEYGLILEKEHFAGVDEGEYRVRVFSPNQKIDLYEIQEGHDLTSDNEILISAGYAVENGVKPGDQIRVNGSSYTVAGTFLRPDYLYMIENTSDDYKNVSTFFLAYMTPEEFNKNFGSGSINNKVVYGDSTDELAFRKEINEDYFMSSYIAADSNMRITFVHEQADMFIMSAWFILGIFPLITVALVCILLGRRIRAEQKLIGTLSSMGYSKLKLMRHYSLYAVIPGIIGGILTSALALILAGPFGRFGLADYEPMRPVFTLPVFVAVAGIIIPTVIYYVAAMLRVHSLLKADTVLLLSGQVGNNSKSRRILSRKKAPVRTKFAVRQLLGNPGRSLVVLLGIFLGAIIVAFAFSFIDSVNAVGEEAHGEFGSFKYEYILNSLKSGSPEAGEGALILPYENGESSRFSVMGLDSDATLWNLTTTDGEQAELDNGIYISTLLEAIFDVHKGDEFTFRNIASLEEYTVKIDGVIKNGYQSYLLTSRNKAAELAGLEGVFYNAVLSDRALEYRSEEITEIISDKTYQTQMENLLKSMRSVIYVFVIIGVTVCIAALYATVNTMITENGHNISMLKVLGLDNKRINSMIISANHLLLVPGIALGILAAYGVMYWYCKEFVEVERIMIPATLYPKSILFTVLITAASYIVSLLLLRRKVDRADMIDALKDER